MSTRIWEHPILGKFEKKIVRIFYDDQAIQAYEGDSVAAALWSDGIKVFRLSEKYHEPLGVFCAIGLCTSCIMTVDGVPNVRTCIVPVREGLKIEGHRSQQNL